MIVLVWDGGRKSASGARETITATLRARTTLAAASRVATHVRRTRRCETLVARCQMPRGAFHGAGANASTTRGWPGWGSEGRRHKPDCALPAPSGNEQASSYPAWTCRNERARALIGDQGAEHSRLDHACAARERARLHNRYFERPSLVSRTAQKTAPKTQDSDPRATRVGKE